MDAERKEGYYQQEVGTDDLPSGIYFYQIDAQGIGEESLQTLETRKMVLVK